MGERGEQEVRVMSSTEVSFKMHSEYVNYKRALFTALKSRMRWQKLCPAQMPKQGRLQET